MCAHGRIFIGAARTEAREGTEVRRIVLITLTATFGVIPTAAWAAAPPALPCATASADYRTRSDLLIERAELAAARVYVMAHRKTEPAPCIRTQLARITRLEAVAKRHLQRALDEAALDHPTRALRHFTLALQIDHSLAAARAGVNALTTPDDDGSPHPFATAGRLAEAGFTKEARASALKELQSNEQADPRNVPKGASPKDDWWLARRVDSVPELIRETLRPQHLAILAAGLLVLFAIIVVVLKLRSAPGKRPLGRPTRWCAHHPPFRWFLAPRVLFRTDASAADTKTDVFVRDAMLSILTRDNRAAPIETAGSDELAAALETFTLQLPGGKFLSAILPKLLGRRTISVQLTLGPAGTAIVHGGLTVVDWRGQSTGAEGFSSRRARPAGPPTDEVGKEAINDAYVGLTDDMAAWLGFVLLGIWNPSDSPIAIAGTKDWKSYALSLRAQRCSGDKTAAQRLNLEALSLDPENVVARLNMTRIKDWDADSIDDVIRVLEKIKINRTDEPTLWASWTYQVASAYTDKGARLTDAQARAAAYDTALAHAAALVNWIDTQSASHGATPAQMAQRLFAERNDLFVQLLRIGCELETSSPPWPESSPESAVAIVDALVDVPARQVLERADEEALVSWPTTYNLACVYAAAYRRLSAPEQADARSVVKDAAFDALRFAVDAAPDATARAGEDPVLTPLRDGESEEWGKLGLAAVPPEVTVNWTVTMSN